MTLLHICSRTNAKGDLPDGSVGTGADRRQVLVTFRDFPYRLIDLLPIKLGSFFLRHSCRSNWRPPTCLSAFWGGYSEPVQPESTFPKFQNKKRNAFFPYFQNFISCKVSEPPYCEMLQNPRQLYARFETFSLFVPHSETAPEIRPTCNTPLSLATTGRGRTETETHAAFMRYSKRMKWDNLELGSQNYLVTSSL